MEEQTNNKDKNSSRAAFFSIFRNTWRLLRIIWEEKKWQLVGIGVTMFILAFMPFFRNGVRGLLINELVHLGVSHTVSTVLIWIFAGMAALGLVSPFLNRFNIYLTWLFRFFIEHKFEILTLEKRGRLDVAIHEDPKMNDLFNKLNEGGIYRIQNFITRQLTVAQDIVEVIIAAVVIVIAKWWLLLLILIFTIPELVVEARYGRTVWNIHTTKAETRRRFWDLRGHFQDTASVIELKLFQNAKKFIGHIEDLFLQFRREENKNERVRLFSRVSSAVLSQVAVTFSTIWFALSVVRGDISIGYLVFLITSIGSLREALSSFFGNLGMQYQDNLFVSDIFGFLDLPDVVKKPQRGIVLDTKNAPEIIFENVSFTYSGQNKPVLENINLTIKPGEKLAIVGVNGAGKTTFVKLLCRFYDPTSGRILINGHDLREIDLESWYYQLGVLFQDYARYRFLTKEAIAVGRTSAEIQMPNVEWAAEYSEASDFIKEWEHGYEQMLGKQFTGGVEPSVGQWQKLALARTFYRGANVIILDEPTSSIDAEAEANIFEKLEKLPQDKTVILISHRFSTVRHADQIVVIENGTVSESGSHEKLLEKNGTYARLFHLQARGYK